MTSGVDPRSLAATVDGAPWRAGYSRANGRVTVDVGGLRSGRHTLVLEVADYQETKNNENVLRILPNTRQYRATFVIP
jgi:hypothetical protein